MPSKSTGYQHLFILALTTGCRQGELLALRWQDLQIDEKLCHIFVSLQRVDGKLQRVPTKTKKSRRTLRLTMAAVTALRQHYVVQLVEKVKAGPLWEPTGYVFTNEFGRPLEGSNVTQQFQGILKRAGLPRRRFHDLRHSFASLQFA